MPTHSNKTVTERFAELDKNRQGYISRGEQYAEWTVPSIFTRDGYTGDTALESNWDSVGASAVNHLTNKIMIALFAPSRPFYRLEAEPEAMVELQQELKAGPVDIKNMFSRAERQTMRDMAQKGLRSALYQTIKLLIVTGNALLYNPPKGQGKPRVYNLKNYVVDRAPDGTVLETIIKEKIAAIKLPEDIREEYAEIKGKKYDPFADVQVYTSIKLDDAGTHYDINQFADDILMTRNHKTKGRVEAEKSRYIPLTWNLVPGQDYGTGHVEDHEGEFNFFTAMSVCMAEAGAIMSEFKFLVNPTGQTDIKDLNSSPNGSYVWGLAADVATPETGKSRDLTWVQSLMDKSEQRIGRAFLMNSAVTRQAERVTAEEIRIQAEELETALGGIYSHLAETAQTPLAIHAIDDLDIAELDKIQPIIITGLDALSRGSEHEQYMLWLNDLTIMNNVPESVLATMNIRGNMIKMATGRGVDYEDSVKTEEELKQAQQEASAQNAEVLAQESAAKAAQQTQE